MRNAKTGMAFWPRPLRRRRRLLLAGAMIVIASGQSMANPAIAAKEKKACAACHTAPPALNDAGKKYKASH